MALPGRLWLSAAVVLVAGTLVPTFVHAHFVLTQPQSWMSQTAAGDPQKLPPCGNEGGGTPTGVITPFEPGETVSITINEVIHHPGHYRVALAINDRSELPPDPPVTAAGGDPCASTQIQDPPIFPVLADGVLQHTSMLSGPQTFTVTLPSDVTCSHCTLQVLEYMSHHGAPCFYHHCADISIGTSSVACGDSVISSGEQCDDGNTDSGDGCDDECVLECTGTSELSLDVKGLDSGDGDDSMTLAGTLTLPAPVAPAVNPAAAGLRLIIDGAAGAILDATLEGGEPWRSNGRGTKWVYRNRSDSRPAGIHKIVLKDRSTLAPGLFEIAVRARDASLAAAAGDDPAGVRLILAPSAGHCADAVFDGCTSASGRLTCE